MSLNEPKGYPIGSTEGSQAIKQKQLNLAYWISTITPEFSIFSNPNESLNSSNENWASKSTSEPIINPENYHLQNLKGHFPWTKTSVTRAGFRPYSLA
nr:hypothetical transcript [Hymenolepis microstoma]